MAQRVERVTQVNQPATTTVPTANTLSQVTESRVTGGALVARFIRYITGVLLVLLAFRFVLALLGANSANGFANFIYSVSHPFVAPFFSLFGYNLRYGVSHFETYTIVAMAVYAIIGFGIARLFTLNHPSPDAV